MHIYRTFIYFFRITTDIIIIIGAFLIAATMTVASFNLLYSTNAKLLLLSLMIIWFFATKSTGLYLEFRSRNLSYELINVAKNIIVLFVATIIILFLLKEETLSRNFVVFFTSFALVLLSVEKFLFRKVLNILRKRGRNLRNLLIIGAGEVGVDFYDLVTKNAHFGYRLMGFLDDSEKKFLNGQYLGKIDELEKVLSRGTVDDVIIALPNYAMDRLENVIKTCERHTTRVRIIPDYFKFVSSKYNVSMFGRFPIITIREDRINELHWRMVKRGFDFAFTSLLYLLIFIWLWPLIALMIKLTSPGPVFFKQERWGRDNKKFITYKFRSMKTDCVTIDDKGKYKQATKNDPRVTLIGRILRKTSFDELPQFWNVLKGEMSIVGPRPHPTPLNIESKDKIHLYMIRHLVKPGITGWAQVNGYRGETENPALMQKRVDNDVWYIENWSLWLDVQIVLLTVWRIITGDPNAY